MRLNPQDISEQFRLHGEDWADKNAAAELLDKNRETVKASLVVEFLKSEKSIARAEYMAESSDEYKRHISSMVEAKRIANRARVQWESDKAFIDMARSAESTRRAEIQNNMR